MNEWDRAAQPNPNASHLVYAIYALVVFEQPARPAVVSPLPRGSEILARVLFTPLLATCEPSAAYFGLIRLIDGVEVAHKVRHSRSGLGTQLSQVPASSKC